MFSRSVAQLNFRYYGMVINQRYFHGGNAIPRWRCTALGPVDVLVTFAHNNNEQWTLVNENANRAVVVGL